MMGNEQNNKFVYSEECDSLLEDALKTEGISETLQKFFYIISLYPNCDFAYYEIGIYFKNSGLYKDAIKYFEKPCMQKFCHNKSLQKAIESYRITPEQKEYIRTLKIK